MLRGNKVNLRVIEKEDLKILQDWDNDVEFVGEFEPFTQSSLSSLQKQYDNLGNDAQWFFVEKKDGTKIGYAAYFKSKSCIGIGYMLVPHERRRSYGSEAVQMIVDYLFLHKDIVRVQAETHPDNKASQRCLEKAGFTKEGLIRKSFFSRGVYRDTAMWSILREEWKQPKILPLGYVKE